MSTIGLALARIAGSTGRASGTIALFFLLTDALMTDVGSAGWLLHDRPGRRFMVVLGLALANAVLEELTPIRGSEPAPD